MAVRVLPPESGTPANLYNNRAAALNELRRFDEARAAGERAVEIGRTVFGAKAVNTAGYMITTAEALVGLHRDADAAATFAEVLTIIDPALPADHEWQAEARTVRAEAALHQGQPQLAMPDLERALKIYGGIASKTYVARRNEALAETALARALFETGVRTARAGELLAKGASTLAALHDQADLDDVGTWAKAHGLTTGL
jgi:tetratricopeptide (TPR) repeat protein